MISSIMEFKRKGETREHLQDDACHDAVRDKRPRQDGLTDTILHRDAALPQQQADPEEAGENKHGDDICRPPGKLVARFFKPSGQGDDGADEKQGASKVDSLTRRLCKQLLEASGTLRFLTLKREILRKSEEP